MDGEEPTRGRVRLRISTDFAMLISPARLHIRDCRCDLDTFTQIVPEILLVHDCTTSAAMSRPQKMKRTASNIMKAPPPALSIPSASAWSYWAVSQSFTSSLRTCFNLAFSSTPPSPTSLATINALITLPLSLFVLVNDCATSPSTLPSFMAPACLTPLLTNPWMRLSSVALLTLLALGSGGIWTSTGGLCALCATVTTAYVVHRGDAFPNGKDK